MGALTAKAGSGILVWMAAWYVEHTLRGWSPGEPEEMGMGGPPAVLITYEHAPLLVAIIESTSSTCHVSYIGSPKHEACIPKHVPRSLYPEA